MLLRILAFLLETAFFLLIGAALLRAWMNWLRVNMQAQPGSFVMALTDWLVKPLRRILPAPLLKARADSASLVAAVLLALLYGVLWGLLFGVVMTGASSMLGFSAAAVLALLGFALKMLLRVALQTVFILVLVYAVMSWLQPGSPVYGLLARLTEPLLAPLRRVIPLVGGVDLSALVLLLVLQVGLMVLG